MEVERLLKCVVAENKRGLGFSAWLELQRYKMYTPFGAWWLRVRYGWDDEKELFVDPTKNVVPDEPRIRGFGTFLTKEEWNAKNKAS